MTTIPQPSSRKPNGCCTNQKMDSMAATILCARTVRTSQLNATRWSFQLLVISTSCEVRRPRRRSDHPLSDSRRKQGRSASASLVVFSLSAQEACWCLRTGKTSDHLAEQSTATVALHVCRSWREFQRQVDRLASAQRPAGERRVIPNGEISRPTTKSIGELPLAEDTGAIQTAEEHGRCGYCA